MKVKKKMNAGPLPISFGLHRAAHNARVVVHVGECDADVRSLHRTRPASPTLSSDCKRHGRHLTRRAAKIRRVIMTQTGGFAWQ